MPQQLDTQGNRKRHIYRFDKGVSVLREAIYIS